MKQRHIIFLLLLFSATLSVTAQNATNVRARQEEETIVITYDLDKKSDIRVYVSMRYMSYKELTAVRGAVGKNVFAGKNLKIIWHPLDERTELVGQDIRFMVTAEGAYDRYVCPSQQGGQKSTETFVLGEVGYSLTPQMGYGLMLGQTYSRYGWYLKGRSNFQFAKIAPSCICGYGGLVDGELPFYSGSKEEKEWIVNAGFVMDFLDRHPTLYNRFNTFGFYIGGGYGKRELYWELSDGRWAKYSPTSYSGVSCDIGLIGSVYGLTIIAGINTINFQYLEFEAGIGWMF